MSSDTTTHEESLLDPETEVEEFPEGQDSEDADQPEDLEDVETRGLTKLALKTNQSLNIHDELLGSLLQSNPEMIGKIRSENPNLADRLAKHKKYASLFSNPVSNQPQADEETVMKSAIAEIVVDGKRLGVTDRNILRKNPTFTKTLKGFLGAGFDPEEAAHKAFREAYPDQAAMVDTSFLSSPTEATSAKKEDPVDLIAEKFSKPETYPPFLRKRMKK